jgi:hypothetical protein
MIRFIFKIILFLSPIAFIFLFPVSAYILGREEYSVEMAVRAQMSDPSITLGKAFIDHDYSGKYYKKVLNVNLPWA